MYWIELTPQENLTLIDLTAGLNHRVEARRGKTGNYYVPSEVLDEPIYAYAHDFLSNKVQIQSNVNDLFD